MISSNTPTHSKGRFTQKGFVLLEVLVVMGLMAGTWMTILEVYQVLSLRHGRLQTQKSNLRKQADAFEIQEYLRANAKNNIQHDSSRLLDRSTTQHIVTQPSIGRR